MKNTKKSFIIENKYVSIEVAKNNSKILSVKDADGNSIKGDNAFFFEFLDAENNAFAINEVSLDGNVATVKSEAGQVELTLEEFDDHFIFEIVKADVTDKVRYFNFANVNFEYDTEDENALRAATISMTVNTNPQFYPDGVHKCFAGQAMPHLGGLVGARLGATVVPAPILRGTLKVISEKIDPEKGIVSKIAGAWALDHQPNFGDYIITNHADAETIRSNIDYCKELGIDQLDFHQGPVSFRQGDFKYMVGNSMEDFRKNVSEFLNEHGIVSGLHTYSYYITFRCGEILSNPENQKQLEMNETFTLDEDITADDTFIPTVESTAELTEFYGFFSKNLPYCLIGEEIVKYTNHPQGFTVVERGFAGTKASAHKKGEKIYHLTGLFNLFCPRPDTPLFKEIAHNTAKAYNEGGFDMIYLDAIDGIHIHLPVGQKHYSWYYHQMFVQRVLSQCNHTPIVETSAGCPQEWNFRGRGGAWDFARFSIKKQIGNHVKANLVSLSRNMTATLGWFCFFVDEYAWGGMKNTIFKTVFHDDMDFLGMNALIYDMSIVFHPLDTVSIKNNPFHYANIKYYTDHYTRLRKSHYFSPEALERVKAVGGEWRVVPVGNEFKFQQIHYCKKNLGDCYSHSDFNYSDRNPFKKQTPFIRIEARFSTLFDEPLVLAEFEGKKFDEERKLQSPTSIRDISSRMAMSIRVKGTGRDGDAALISLSGGITLERAGRGDHFIDLNFEGWRDFILIDNDNGDYDYEKYAFDGIATTSAAATTFRYCPSFEKIDQVVIRVTGETAHNAEFGNLVSYVHAPSPIKNPSFKVGDSEMIFNCSLHGGDYIEYDPETDKALLYHNMEQTVEEISFEGKISVPSGDFTATYSAEKESDAPLRAKLVLGFIGEELNR